ncbi:hypothetical protein NDQ53_14380 [Rossellomorea marisflavi]|uniref:hypothetical protein n=1 Tax=Rossellomorea marisflavi TaxID=189381 RepID=UPI00203AB0EB|nr:hypothetical protein [Rossellomorea marisflavi]MCM2590486.1 hypothetical protein [Rossellomorea marisflavi]
MFVTKETKRIRQLELYKNGDLAQKVCMKCQRVKLSQDFPRYSNGNTRAYCKLCYKIQQANYTQSIKDKRTVYKQRERARELGLPDHYTDEDYKALKKFSNGHCLLSGVKTENLQVDHFMALSKRGLGSTKGNIILVSEEVNQKKGTKSIFELMNSNLVDKEQLKRTIKYLAEKNEMTVSQYIQFLQDMEEIAHIAKGKGIWR